MGVIERDEFGKLTGLDKLGLKGATDVLMDLLRLNKLNDVYDKFSGEDAVSFCSGVLRLMGIKYEVSEEELKRIPKSGPFIIVSNHPYGGIDGVILIKTLVEQRPDFKIMGNFLLERVEPLQPHLISVNPFESRKGARSSHLGIKEFISHIEAGHCAGIFPAGEVSSIKLGKGTITDREWQFAALRLLKKANVPIVPVYFHGSNSILFHLLGLLHPALRTAQIPAEMLKRRNKKIVLRIGKPISVDDQQQFDDIKRFGRFIRQKVYLLGKPLTVNRFFLKGILPAPKQQEIIAAVEPTLMEQEFAALLPEQHLLTHKDYELYLAPAESISNVLTEIGRLRELTFRDVGEGTNKEIDVDEFDLYYHHLVLWDRKERKLIGAYRLGLGQGIMAQYGPKGFYFQTLFRLDPQFRSTLETTIELGRAFIVKEYQNKPYPLFLLWKGLTITVLRNPQYRHFIGCVSISNNFSKVSKKLIIEFVKKNYFDNKLAQYVHPRNRYKVRLKKDTKALIEETSNMDMNSVDRFIEEFEPGGLRLPVLLKKYVKQNARIIGFNVDPKFNYALDGLMILDLLDLPMQTMMQVIDDIGDESLIEEFFQRKREEKKSLE
jgi:putative hemolysin